MRITANILHYNCEKLLYQTIDSVLMQDYEDIELIIRDDHTPAGFDVDGVRAYIDAHKKENIKRVEVIRGEENVGTVRNLELMRQIGEGEIDLSIAGDDVWADEHVFSAFAEAFAAHPETLWITSQVDMRDDELKKHESYFVSERTKAVLQSQDAQAIWNMAVQRCVLPSLGTAYRRAFFEKIGRLSDSYYLIEDYTSHLRALRQGYLPYYLDRLTALHRGGGISHGNRRYFSRTQILYYLDSKRVFEREILPYRDKTNPQSFAVAKTLYDYNVRTFRNATDGLFRRGIVQEEDDLRTVTAEQIQKYSEVRYFGIRRSVIKGAVEHVLRIRVIAAFAVLAAAFWIFYTHGVLPAAQTWRTIGMIFTGIVILMGAAKAALMARMLLIQHRIKERY